MHDDVDPGEPCIDGTGVVVRKDTVVEAESTCLLANRAVIPASENRPHATRERALDDEPPRVAVRAVDERAAGHG